MAVLLVIFILMNIAAFFHAYKFTHFTGDSVAKTKIESQLSPGEKLRILFFGVNNPKPVNRSFPKQQYETVRLQSGKQIECWYIKADSAKGTVVLFHGYSSSKSSMLEQSDEFLRLGYNTFLVDFRGCGGSEGTQTTIGFKEAEDVKTCFDYLSKKEKNIYLFGTSMGAVAILKAIRDYRINPSGIIIECPFGSMYQTVCSRFRLMNVPSFPEAGLLLF